MGTVTTIAVAPSNTNYIYAGTDDSYIWVSKNNGANWTKISSGLPTRWVTRVVVDPNNPNTVYATFSGLRWKDPESHVYKSTNAGETWINISSNLPDAPVNAFAVYTANTNVLCLGNDIGMFISYNKGETWEVLGNGLPVVPINDMKIDPETNNLVIGTHGRGMYKINLATVLSDVDDNYSMQPEMFKLSQNYPNPFNPETSIEFYIPKEGKVKIEVFNSIGELVYELTNKNYTEGNYKLNFNAKNISSGVYYYQMTYNNKYSKTNKMVVIK
ncbi:MAG TPA: T9SS type A sorting domain-containing protein [Melioribacteraceae bacterium]|nr:T9SS type A sorting domain-containing protein [Melioribacteraceae bacterium]